MRIVIDIPRTLHDSINTAPPDLLKRVIRTGELLSDYTEELINELDCIQTPYLAGYKGETFLNFNKACEVIREFARSNQGSETED